MSKLEREIKILDIDVEETKKRLDMLGAKYLGVKEQKIFTYDIPTIKHRFEEALALLESSNKLIIKTAIRKMEIIFDEFSDLVSTEKLNTIFTELDVIDFNELLTQTPDLIVSRCKNSPSLLEEISNTLINPNKWLRLRQSNEKIELTLKHIYEKETSSIQHVKECEIEVSNIEDTNRLLEEIGLVRRNYQEKIRYSYVYDSAEIEIDEWPGLEPYLEIECDDEKLINKIVELLKYESKEIVSLNTEQLYKRKGINILEMSDLKFYNY